MEPILDKGNHPPTFEAPSTGEIVEKAFNSCAKAVNNKIPGSFKETAPVNQKVAKGIAIGGFAIASVISGGTLPAVACVVGLGCVLYKAFEHAQAANAGGNNQQQISAPAPDAEESKSSSFEKCMPPNQASEEDSNSSEETPKVATKSVPKENENLQTLGEKPKSGTKPLNPQLQAQFIRNQVKSMEKPASKVVIASAPPEPTIHNFSTREIESWLFEGGKAPNSDFPPSKLKVREQGKYAPKMSFSEVAMLSKKGKYTSRIGIYKFELNRGGITGIKAEKGQRAAVGDSNNGDLLTGCGFPVAKAIINAAGPNLQREIYNKYGVPKYMETPKHGQDNYSHTEGRGYSLTCDAHDMKETHNIEKVEFMTVPMDSVEGVRNMYKEAFEHSKDLDFIVLPMAGMTHAVLSGKPELSAQIATEEFKKFVDAHPDSHLKVVFAILEENNVLLYKAASEKLEGS